MTGKIICAQCLKTIHNYDYYIVYFDRIYCSLDCMTYWSEMNEARQEAKAMELFEQGQRYARLE